MTREERLHRGRKILALLGWKVDTDRHAIQATEDFQRMFNLGPALVVDGKLGPKTYAALVICRDRKVAGKSDISEHFSVWEFKCKCGGKHETCRRIWVDRQIVQACEKIRTKIGPFTPLSTCRCDKHNAAVKGYKRSQHRLGFAIDFDVPQLTAKQMTALRVADAIGVGANGKVRHIDLRASGSPDNHPKASGDKANPYIYHYK